MIEHPLAIVRKGQPITILAESGDVVSLVDQLEIVLKRTESTTDQEVSISTNDLTPDKYLVIVESANGDLVQMMPVKLMGLFEKEDRVDSLRSQLELLDKVIQAKLSDDQGVLTQLSINSKTLVYSSLADLVALSDSLRTQLAQAVRTKRAKQGKSPMTAIKIKFTRD